MRRSDPDDPIIVLDNLINTIAELVTNDQGIEGDNLVDLQQRLDNLKTSVENLVAQSQLGQIGVIISIDHHKAIVAGNGRTRYEVDLHRLPSSRQRIGQKVILTPDITYRPLVSRYQEEFHSQVGAVGRISNILSQEHGLARLQLSEGVIVGATEEVMQAGPNPGDAVRYDPDQLLAFELITNDRWQRLGNAGLVTCVFPGTPLRLELVYGAGETFIVEPTAELTNQTINVGDWVNFDANTRLAFGKTVRPSETGGYIGEIIDIHTTWHSDGSRTRRIHASAGGHQDLLLRLGPDVENKEFSVGDLVRIDPNALLVLEQLKAYDLSEVRPEEIGDVPYEKIGGLHTAVSDIRKSIEWPYLFPDAYRAYNLRGTKGILLYGPPGNGKTLIAKAIASNLRTQILEELDKLEVQQHLANLIRALQIQKVIVQTETIPSEVFRDWDNLFSTLGETTQSYLRTSLQPEPYTKDDLQKEVKAYLLASDVANLDTPDAEIGKIWELRNTDPHGQPKRPRPKGYFINVSGPELLTKWVGETEHKIRKLFEKARRASGPYTPVIIFFDEIESMFQTRGSGISSDVEKTIVPQFLAELDGVHELRNVLVIGASNRVELIDPALLRPGRLDRKIKIDRPNEESAVEILLKHLVPKLPTTTNVSELARQLIEILYDERSHVQITQKQGERITIPARQFVSGAILESVVTRAKKAAVERWISEVGLREKHPVGPPTNEIGLISLESLTKALQQEYDENKDHFAMNLLELQPPEQRRLSLDEITVTVRWASQAENRWNDVPPEVS